MEGCVLIDKCCICNSEIDKDLAMYIILPDGKIACQLCMSYIADLRLSNSPLQHFDRKTRKTYNFITIQDPHEIYDSLSQYIVGQDKAKKVLSVAAYNHYIRILTNDYIEKSNVLLIGPSGTGKTSLVKALAKILNLPLAITSATSLTEAGYIGNDVETVVQNLFLITGGNVSLTEQGIIFIDEVDKLSSVANSYNQVGHKGVQQALLPLLDGTIVSIPSLESKNGSNNAKVDIDTSNILFICGGAFPEIEDIVLKRISHKPAIGFQPSGNKKGSPDNSLETYLPITADDVKEYGIIPELIGRLPIIAPLDKLTISTLKKILTVPKHSLVSQYRVIFAHKSINLLFKDEALEEIAQMAFDQNTGARALRSIMENLLLDFMFDLPNQSDISEIIITKGFVVGNESPIITRDIYSQSCNFN